ncbi:MAG: rRNA processing protein RimM [Clostridiales bacterium]|nr:rRNA processing protein RimM [Clostridiales bacterium]
MEDLLRVGVISSTHGIRGEVKVFPTTDDNNRFKKLKEVLLDTGAEPIPLSIESVRFFKQMVILKFRGMDSINDVEKYKGKDLLIPREQAVPLEENEYFIYDILGAKVLLGDGTVFGILQEVLTTGANDVFVVKLENGKEVLLPVIDDCVKDMDIPNKTVTIELMPGLLDDKGEE